MRTRSGLLILLAAVLASSLALVFLVRAPPSVSAPADRPAPAPPPVADSADSRAVLEEVGGGWREPAPRGGDGAARDGQEPPRGEAPTDGAAAQKADEEARIPPPRAFVPVSELDARHHEVSRIYNRREFEAAKAEAEAVLAEHPNDRRMLRIAVSSACILGERAEAEELYERLEPPDRRAIRDRCARHGVALAP